MPILETEVILSLQGLSPVAFQHLYRIGDRWEKIVGCEQCSIEDRKQCCGGTENCEAFRENGCYYNLSTRKMTDKPLYCILKPYPDTAMSFCHLTYKCTEDMTDSKTLSRVGLIRRVCDPGNVFRKE